MTQLKRTLKHFSRWLLKSLHHLQKEWKRQSKNKISLWILAFSVYFSQTKELSDFCQVLSLSRLVGLSSIQLFATRIIRHFTHQLRRMHTWAISRLLRSATPQQKTRKQYSQISLKPLLRSIAKPKNWLKFHLVKNLET